MTTSRLEAFSDGVLAIIITIMVLELHVPHGDGWAALRDAAPSFSTYALSFVYVGIYWNNHHHMFQVIEYVSGGVLWANLHLLFWLSLFPFSTGWMDASGFARVPTIVYGVNLLLAAIAFYLVEVTVKAGRGGSRLAAALGRDLKGKLSPFMYLTGIALALLTPWLGVAVFVVAALVWLVPDRRVERYLRSEAAAQDLPA
ncbi:MAG TPA: TMEM175 family protein [Nocardioidaceae bacterium]|jgi:uncharacterized membrane protein|nr:TMEM175 family protein [Nocardioidaceae bacterium]